MPNRSPSRMGSILVCVLLLSGFSPAIYGQEALEAELDMAARYASHPPATHMFSGRLYRRPPTSVEGDPWLSPLLEPASLSWLGTEMTVDYARYDIVIDRLILFLEQDGRNVMISLDSGYVDWFHIHGREFASYKALPGANPPSGFRDGYHEVVFRGDSISFFVRHEKKLLSVSSSASISYEFQYKAERVVYLAGEYQRFTGLRSLLSVMRAEKKQIRAFIRSQNISVRKASAEELVPVFERFEQLVSET